MQDILGSDIGYPKDPIIAKKIFFWKSFTILYQEGLSNNQKFTSEVRGKLHYHPPTPTYWSYLHLPRAVIILKFICLYTKKLKLMSCRLKYFSKFNADNHIVSYSLTHISLNWLTPLASIPSCSFSKYTDSIMGAISLKASTLVGWKRLCSLLIEHLLLT